MIDRRDIDPTSTDNYPYNDDLLLAPGDQENARRFYGPVANALIFPELIELFLPVDARANRAKLRLRNLGFGSVVMLTLALLAASSAPFYEHADPWAAYIVITSALLGVAGGLLGFGLFSRNAKATWLECRLVTEGLRALHFRLLVVLSPQIIRAADAFATDHDSFEPYYQLRAQALEEFRQNVVLRRSEELTRLLDNRETRPPIEINSLPSADVFDGKYGRVLLEAYATLRMRRQCQYADHMLKDDGRILSRFPRTQARVIGGLGVGCVVMLFALHLYSASVPLLASTEPLPAHLGALLPQVHQLAVWIALIALVLRAIEEGLKPRTEIDRYRHYRITTERLSTQFKARDVGGKVQIMSAMENVVHDEMVNFLRSNSEARFIM